MPWLKRVGRVPAHAPDNAGVPLQPQPMPYPKGHRGPGQEPRVDQNPDRHQDNVRWKMCIQWASKSLIFPERPVAFALNYWQVISSPLEYAWQWCLYLPGPLGHTR